MPVPPLSLQAPPGAVSPACELFLQRAHAVAPTARLDDVLVERVRTRLDGVPLAIELAAARAAVLAVEDIERSIDRSLDVLSGGRSGHRRHASVAASIDWSFSLLDPPARRLLQLLSVFRSPFTLADAEMITGGQLEVRALASVVEKSLVIRLPGMAESLVPLPERSVSSPASVCAAPGCDRRPCDRHLGWLVARAEETDAVFEGERLPVLVELWRARLADVSEAVEWARATAGRTRRCASSGACGGSGGRVHGRGEGGRPRRARDRRRDRAGPRRGACRRRDEQRGVSDFLAAAHHAQRAAAIAESSHDAGSVALEQCWLGWMLAPVDPAAALAVVELGHCRQPTPPATPVVVATH